MTGARRPAPRPPTIRDVSQLADVSRMTVSRVLSDPDLVRPETRERVRKAISHLGYVPDRAAGSLSTRRSGFVGLVLPTLTNANFSTVAHGLTAVLRRGDYSLLITYTDYSLREEEEQLRALVARRPEAIVLAGTIHSRAATAMLLRAEVPVIELADLSTRPIQYGVGFSNHRAGRMAARYFHERGFRRIGALGSHPEADLADHRGEARLRGFEEEARLLGLSAERIVREGPAPVSFDHGAAAIGTLLDRHPDVEAVFCISDLSAVGALMECQRRGIAVPDRLSIMGFGDFDIARVVNPPLTSIRVDFLHLGQQVGELVLRLLGRAHADCPTTTEVDMRIVERGSVGDAHPGSGA